MCNILNQKGTDTWSFCNMIYFQHNNIGLVAYNSVIINFIYKEDLDIIKNIVHDTYKLLQMWYDLTNY